MNESGLFTASSFFSLARSSVRVPRGAGLAVGQTLQGIGFNSQFAV
jgi:hypothetical protein